MTKVSKKSQTKQSCKTGVIASDNLMVCVSGGRSSAYMAWHIQNSEKYKHLNKIYVFCNTGMERPETIDFLKNIVKHWKIDLNIIEGVFSNEMNVGVRYKLVDFDTMNMNGKPFSEMIEHKNKGVFDGLPNPDAPYCSDMMKTRPAKSFADEIFGVNNYKKAIGFRKEDMPKRITWGGIVEDKERIFPLLTDFMYPTSQSDLSIFFDYQPFKLEIHNKYGNCELCWKKSEPTLIENIKFGTRFIDWHREHEQKYSSTFFRGHKSIDELIKLSKLPTTGKLNFVDDDSCVCNF